MASTINGASAYAQRGRDQGPEEQRASPEAAPTPVAAQELTAEVSSGVFKKILWASAFIALLVYFPWVIALLVAVWGLVWERSKRFQRWDPQTCSGQ